MRKPLLVLTLAAAVAIAGCGGKQAAPSQQPTPSPSSSAPNGQTNTPAGNTPASPAPTAPPASNAQSGTDTPAPTPKPIPKPPAGAAAPPTITMQQYDQIQFNTTFDEVQKAIGLGKLVKQTEHQAMYDYVIKEGGTAEFEFWDGKLNSKSARDASNFVPPAQAKSNTK